MTFYDAYHAILERGSLTIPMKTNHSDFIEVWASKITKGPRKGEEVLRIKRAESSLTIDGNDWLEGKSALVRHVRLTIESLLEKERPL